MAHIGIDAPARTRAVRWADVTRAAVWATAAFCTLSAAWVVAHTAWFLAWNHADLPFADGWAPWKTASDILEGRQSVLEGLMAAHNEHRIVLTRIGFAIDLLLGGDDVVLQGLTVGAQGLTALVLARAAWDRAGSCACGLAGASTIVALLASLRQGDNLSSGFQMQFTWTFMVPVMAAQLATRWKRPKAAMALCLLAPLTMANGFACGLSVAAAMAIAGMPWRGTAAYAGISVGAVACAGMLGALPHAGASAGHGVPDALQVDHYLLVFLGGAATSGRAVWATVAGAAALGAAALAVAKLRGMGPNAVVPLVAVVFTITSAAMSACVRTADGWPVGQALSGRYDTASAVLWSGLIATCAIPRGRGWRAAMLATCGAMSLLTLRDSHSYDRVIARRSEASKSIERALKADPTGDSIPKISLSDIQASAEDVMNRERVRHALREAIAELAR